MSSEYWFMNAVSMGSDRTLRLTSLTGFSGGPAQARRSDSTAPLSSTRSAALSPARSTASPRMRSTHWESTSGLQFLTLAVRTVRNIEVIFLKSLQGATRDRREAIDTGGASGVNWCEVLVTGTTTIGDLLCRCIAIRASRPSPFPAPSYSVIVDRPSEASSRVMPRRLLRVPVKCRELTFPLPLPFPASLPLCRLISTILMSP